MTTGELAGIPSQVSPRLIVKQIFSQYFCCIF